jgi:uncharacterized ubiquitin-like protein YukD
MTTLDSVEQVLRMLSYIATPVVAVAALKIASQQARIAGQQARVNERKYEADLYERRLRIYEEVKRLLSIVTRDANISMQDLLKFRIATSEADFLFGSDVTTYIDNLHKHAVDLAMWNSMFRDSTQEQPPDYDHKTVVERKHRELKWITSQYEPSKEMFKKYLRVSQ